MDWNSLKLDTNIKPIYAKSISEFNELVSQYPETENKIILTKGNNIAQENLRHMPCSLTWKRGNHMEYHYITAGTHVRIIYAIHYDEQSDTDPKTSWEAVNYFGGFNMGLMGLIPTDDIEENITLFTCPENPNSNYYNYVYDRLTNMQIDNCYSLDRNKSFLASMLTVYPQSKPYIDKWKRDYELAVANNDVERKQKLKDYAVCFIGWLNNPKTHRSHAWKKIINDANMTVHNLRKEIEANGNMVLLVNTDAVKFIGNYDYNESTEFGQFKYEWKDTEMYIKGVKSYAYLDNNKWKFKQAGKCKLDEIKPREEWTLDEFINGPTEQQKRIITDGRKLIEIYE